MNISNEARAYLVDEIKFAVDMMKESSEWIDILYYYSAIFGAVNRIYNLEYDDELVYLHFVTQTTHQQLSQGLTALQQGNRAVFISGEQFDKLINLSEELGKKIQKKEGIDDTLKKIIILLYSTQGNGHYLMKKGVLKI